MGIKKKVFKTPQRKTKTHFYYTAYEIGKYLDVPKHIIHYALTAYGHEGLFNIEKFKPFAHLFEQFQRTSRDQIRAFGIKKMYWDHYLEYGKIPEKLGIKPLDPLDPDSYRANHLQVKAPPFYGRFKAGLLRANYDSLKKTTLEQAVWMALQEFMDRRPEYFYPEEGTEDGGKTEI